jgi:hypothetical protein
MCIVVVTMGFLVQLGVLRQLQHDRSHHFVVLMAQNVAVVDVSRKLSQLIVRHVEVSTFFCILFSEVGFGPSDAIVKGFERLHKGSVFQTTVIRLSRWMAFVSNINELILSVIFIQGITQV